MIEKILLEFLAAHLDVPVYLEKPAKPPVKMVLIEKTGSVLTNLISGATMAIQSYGGSLVDTIELNEQVKRAMEGFIELNSIGGCDFSTDYNFTDTQTKQHRYQAVYYITYYGGN
jgi:hypothetical protein